MPKKLFVGSLPFSMDSEELKQLFSECGEVLSAQVIKDRETGRSRGFGFVEFASEEEADNAVERFNNANVNGRAIVVNPATSTRRPSRV